MKLSRGDIVLEEYALDKARVILFNPMQQMRATLREALHNIGFRRIAECGNIEQTQDELLIESPELLILDLDRNKDDVCNLVRDVRNGNYAKDPFIVIMALTWKPHLQKVNTTMDAGIDDIVLLPLSIGTLRSRVNMMIQKRKGFVVTGEYIGPNRRIDDRIDDELGTITVPNRLRFKATGDVTAMASPEAVDEARVLVDNHRLNRFAQRLHALLDILTNEEASTNDDAVEVDMCLDEMGDVIRDLHNRVEDNDSFNELTNICQSMEDLLTLLHQSTTTRLFDLMRVHAHAVTATLMNQDGAAELIARALGQATTQIAAKSA
jgi:DNA-binding response OmpR family regulator